MKRAEGVTEVAGDVLWGPALEEISAERFVHAVLWVFRFEEECSFYLF
jgi:hypothetical protein